MSFVSKHCEYIYGNSDMLETVGMRKEHHPDPGSLVNVRTLGAKSLPILLFDINEPSKRPVRHLIRVTRKHDLTNILTILSILIHNF